MLTTITIKKVELENTEVMLEGKRATVSLSFKREDIPMMYRRLIKLLSGFFEEEVKEGDTLKAVTTGEVWRVLNKEYLVAPGKKLAEMFKNNHIEIAKA